MVSATRPPSSLVPVNTQPLASSPETKLGLWRRSSVQALGLLEEFSQNLLDNVKRFRGFEDKNGADVISSSCIACLAHLGILYEVFCRTDPDAGETYDLCDLALERLGMLTSELDLDEYTYLDLLVGVRPSSLAFFIDHGDSNGDRNLGGKRSLSSTSG